MLFNSFEFGLFFLLVYGLYLILMPRFRTVLLLGASYLFYAAWDVRFLSLIILSTIVDYGCGRWLERAGNARVRRLALALSLLVNLGILGFFKYCNFFLENLEGMFALVGWSVPGYLAIVLPVGISFYTFQTLSYTIDCYRREIPACRNLLDFALFVAFFPQLVAGPIERAKRLLPQIQAPRRIRYEDLRVGAWLILLGYFKKVVVADNLAPLVDPVFDQPGKHGALTTLLGIYGFAFQIYCDFSGYSDIARGLARVMGFELMVNFRMPYFAANPREFWQRWHISLSTWLRDYLYIPLGGNRHGPLRTQFNLLATMLLGGLWHGAAWPFVAWGLYQGLLLALHRRFVGPMARWTQNWPVLPWRLIRIGFFFQFVCLGWILFRVRHLSDVPKLLGGLLEFERLLFPPGWIALWVMALVAPLLFLWFHKERSGDLLIVKRWTPAVRLTVYLVLFCYIFFCGVTNGDTFIYFQF